MSENFWKILKQVTSVKSVAVCTSYFWKIHKKIKSVESVEVCMW